jgi:ATP-binding cassette subfamily F protein uup
VTRLSRAQPGRIEAWLCAARSSPTGAAAARGPAKRLTWAEQREWDGIEAAIVAEEEMLARCQAAAHDPAIATRADELAARWREAQVAQDAVDQLFARWAELDEKRG